MRVPSAWEAVRGWEQGPRRGGHSWKATSLMQRSPADSASIAAVNALPGPGRMGEGLHSRTEGWTTEERPERSRTALVAGALPVWAFVMVRSNSLGADLMPTGPRVDSCGIQGSDEPSYSSSDPNVASVPRVPASGTGAALGNIRKPLRLPRLNARGSGWAELPGATREPALREEAGTPRQP